MLKHIKDADVRKIIESARRNNVAHPPSERRLVLDEAGQKLGQLDPTSDSLNSAIGALRLEARQELMALVWLGHAERDATFDQHLAHAKRNSEKTEVNYIREMSALLPQYLRAGLSRLNPNQVFEPR